MESGVGDDCENGLTFASTSFEDMEHDGSPLAVGSFVETSMGQSGVTLRGRGGSNGRR